MSSLKQLFFTYKISPFSGDPLQEDDFTDCHIECQGVKFYAHQCVLARRSSALRAALTTKGMKEAETSCVVIDDFLPTVVQAFLTSLYWPGFFEVCGTQYRFVNVESFEVGTFLLCTE